MPQVGEREGRGSKSMWVVRGGEKLDTWGGLRLPWPVWPNEPLRDLSVTVAILLPVQAWGGPGCSQGPVRGRGPPTTGPPWSRTRWGVGGWGGKRLVLMLALWSQTSTLKQQ